MNKKTTLISSIFILLVCVSLAQCSTDLSAILWYPWPAKCYRPPLPADAVKVLAPPRSITWIESASKGKIYGTNLKWEYVWATVKFYDGYKEYSIWRKGECGNPAGGCWSVKIQCEEKPIVICEEQSETIVNTEVVVNEAPQLIPPVPFDVGGYVHVQPNMGGTEYYEKDLVDVFLFQDDEECNGPGKKPTCDPSGNPTDDPSHGNVP